MKTFHPLRIKWPLWFGCALWLGLELALFACVTREALGAARAGGPVPGEWSWLSITGWHLFIACLGGALLWEPFVQLRTRFDDEGVSRPRLFKPPVCIRWAEVETLWASQVRQRPYVLQVKARAQSIEINTLFYRRPEQVFSFVEERVKSCMAPACR